MRGFGFYFVLSNARLYKFQYANKCIPGNFTGFFGQLYLNIRFQRPQIAQDDRRAFVIMQWIFLPQLLIHPDIPVWNRIAIPVVIICIDVDVISIINYTVQYGIIFAKPLYVFDTRCSAGLFLSIFM